MNESGNEPKLSSGDGTSEGLFVGMPMEEDMVKNISVSDYSSEEDIPAVASVSLSPVLLQEKDGNLNDQFERSEDKKSLPVSAEDSTGDSQSSDDSIVEVSSPLTARSVSSTSSSSSSSDELSPNGTTKRRCSATKKCTAPVAFCIFEYVYFARPDSIFEGHSVYDVRYKTGELLALEHPVEADFVCCVPTTASVAAKGFASKSGLPYQDLLYRSHFVGRSFIESDQNTRKRTVLRKFSLYSENFVRGKRVVLVDDSLVRGTTIEPIVEMIKNAGALEVHFRVASPPIRHPCYMGINIPTREELAANRAPLDLLASKWNLDSLKYLSLEGLHAAVNDGIVLEENRTVGHCTACLDGIYPVELDW
ncbi:hypothetical protein HAZT_HAZT004243 [Hyalella azteca]|nr:hypothetical protein HAZT_HAZT004243 [Hyalella azteca]